MTTNPPFAYEPPPARQILEQHGLPEDVIDGVLAVHAQELAAVQRRDAALWGVDALTDAVLAVLPDPTDRAALLTEAADGLGRMDYDTDSNDYGYDTYRDAWNGGVMDGADLLRRLAAEAAVVPPPALTEEGRLRAQVEVLQQDAERDQGLAKVGARCMRDGHQGLIEQGRLVLEGWRFALSTALDIGTDAPWEAIHERVKELRRLAAEAPTTKPETVSRQTLVDLIRDFLDPDPCQFDHHGYCQAHAAGFGGEPLSCPHGRARKVLAVIDAAGVRQDGAQPQEVVHACPPDGSGLTPCCGRTPFELPRTDRISSEPGAVTCAPAVVAQPGKETQT